MMAESSSSIVSSTGRGLSFINFISGDERKSIAITEDMSEESLRNLLLTVFKCKSVLGLLGRNEVIIPLALACHNPRLLLNQDWNLIVENEFSVSYSPSKLSPLQLSPLKSSPLSITPPSMNLALTPYCPSNTDTLEISDSAMQLFEFNQDMIDMGIADALVDNSFALSRSLQGLLEDKFYICPNCEQNFATKVALKQHIENKACVCICIYCKRKIFGISSIKSHINTCQLAMNHKNVNNQNILNNTSCVSSGRSENTKRDFSTLENSSNSSIQSDEYKLNTNSRDKRLKDVKCSISGKKDDSKSSYSSNIANKRDQQILNEVEVVPQVKIKEETLPDYKKKLRLYSNTITIIDDDDDDVIIAIEDCLETYKWVGEPIKVTSSETYYNSVLLTAEEDGRLKGSGSSISPRGEEIISIGNTVFIRGQANRSSRSRSQAPELWMAIIEDLYEVNSKEGLKRAANSPSLKVERDSFKSSTKNSDKCDDYTSMFANVRWFCRFYDLDENLRRSALDLQIDRKTDLFVCDWTDQILLECLVGPCNVVFEVPESKELSRSPLSEAMGSGVFNCKYKIKGKDQILPLSSHSAKIFTVNASRKSLRHSEEN